jgi:AcrR family transcriptional regulator
MNKRSAEESRRLILAAAGAVFAEQGYSHASMRDIARAAGMSVGGLYLSFRNKEELYQTFMLDWMNNLNDRTHEALARFDDPVDAMRAFITVSIEFARSHKEMIIFQGRIRGFTFGLDLRRDFFRERRSIIAEIIKRGIESGDFARCDAEQYACIIFNTLRGLIVSMVIDEGALFTADDCIDLVLHGLLRRENR